MKSEPFVKGLLDKYFPRTYLESVPIFRPDKAILPYQMANEIDFILHSQEGNKHIIVIIECKDCRIEASDNKPLDQSNEWNAIYPNGPKGIKAQIRAQFISLVHNLDPLDEKELLVRHGVVVSSQLKENFKSVDKGILGRPDYCLMGYETFRSFIENWEKKASSPYLVNQSEILRRLRCSKAVYNLGHPETRNAISYSARCRRFIDSELFSHFRPRESHWAINGSAGMGKSVLLAYAMQVFITDMIIVDRRGDTSFRDLNSFEDRAKEIGLVGINERQVWLVAQSEKQRDSLIEMHKSFSIEYAKINEFTHFQRVSPQIKLWSEIDSLESCNVLLIDEAHDLSLGAQERIREWHEKGKKRYLAVAIDRHQKLNLISSSANIIQGINFGSHTVKLRRNYRNSFPVYVASFGILFRWFAKKGMKIAPTIDDLKSGMGFMEARRVDKGSLRITTRNDSHPANIWHNLVSVLPSVKVAYTQLHEEGLSKKDVLWVRFSEENEEFNYEKLDSFTYFNLHSDDSSALIDKYIKGQEFPVVVIEGLPPAFNLIEGVCEREMWLSRRQVYMASSRANVFLHFVLGEGVSPESKKELMQVSREVSGFSEEESPSGRMWSLEIAFGGGVDEIPMSKYLKLIENEEVIIDEGPFEEKKEGGEPSKTLGEDQEITQDLESEKKEIEKEDPSQIIGEGPLGEEKEAFPSVETKQYSSSEVFEALRPFGLKRIKPKNAGQSETAEKILIQPKLLVKQDAGTFCIQLSEAIKNLHAINSDISKNGGAISSGILNSIGLKEGEITSKHVIEASQALKAFGEQNTETEIEKKYNLKTIQKKPAIKENVDAGSSIQLAKAVVSTPISVQKLSKALSIKPEVLKKTIDCMAIYKDTDIFSADAKKIAKVYGYDLTVKISSQNPTLDKFGLTTEMVKSMTKE